jgi:Uma2 family endonuclease
MLIADRKHTTVAKPAAIPKYLIRETIDGDPFYYKGYRQILSGKKTLEDLMGASILQSYIISYLHRQIALFLNYKKYHALISEPGLHIDHRNNLSGDVLIYERSVLTADKVTTKYANVPAKVVLEVDVKIDDTKTSDWDYVQRKTQKLLDFGTEKVVWVFTKTQKVIVATANGPWLTYNWNNDLEIVDGIFFNIGDYLKEEGITVESMLK